MDEHIKRSNYDTAKAEADIADNEIIDALKQGFNFRVEAGAGSGKTYSLNRVIEWIQANKISDFNRKKQNVICITPHYRCSFLMFQVIPFHLLFRQYL